MFVLSYDGSVKTRKMSSAHQCPQLICVILVQHLCWCSASCCERGGCSQGAVPTAWWRSELLREGWLFTGCSANSLMTQRVVARGVAVHRVQCQQPFPNCTTTQCVSSTCGDEQWGTGFIFQISYMNSDSQLGFFVFFLVRILGLKQGFFQVQCLCTFLHWVIGHPFEPNKNAVNVMLVFIFSSTAWKQLE